MVVAMTTLWRCAILFGLAVALRNQRGKYLVDVDDMVAGDGCARSDIDIYRPSDGDTCFVRMYACIDYPNIQHPDNRNTGDLAWALSKKCSQYGTFLHIFRVEVAKPAMVDTHSRYSQCNFGTCGCPPDRDMCNEKKRNGYAGVNYFGRRTVDYTSDHYDTCPCANFALPRNAMGNIDAERTAALIQNRHRGTASAPQPYQWKPACIERVIDRKACLAKFVMNGTNKVQEDVTFQQRAAAFQHYVLHGNEPACKDVRQPVWDGSPLGIPETCSGTTTPASRTPSPAAHQSSSPTRHEGLLPNADTSDDVANLPQFLTAEHPTCSKLCRSCPRNKATMHACFRGTSERQCAESANRWDSSDCSGICKCHQHKETMDSTTTRTPPRTPETPEADLPPFLTKEHPTCSKLCRNCPRNKASMHACFRGISERQCAEGADRWDARDCSGVCECYRH